MVVMKTNTLDQLSRFVRFIKWQRLFALQSSASMRGVSCTLWNLMTSEAEEEATRTEGDTISTCAIFGLFV
ncbi:hypothetical protein PVAP13_4NG210521 [Panicum virgatum]|uniref:Uncharacterized protein n=1 Tax=Panicum virgatum TaxID=38727 RepID=A0A8T0TB21_PANVG|nr:hypothetical protein PVAP13_4NG210521 [Panicum virgatum]